MNIAVVTSFSEEGFRKYGRDCVESFCRFWPQGIPIHVYYENTFQLYEGPFLTAENRPTGKQDAKIHAVNLLETQPCKAFLKKHHDDRFAQGLDHYPGHSWRPNATRAGYNFRFDAYKFARKVFAIQHAANIINSGKLFWIDADVQTRKPVPVEFLNGLFPDGIAISHIDRPGYHSECGFVGYNLDHPSTLPFINEFARIYSQGRFMDFSEWHDSYIFDRLLERLPLPTYKIAWANKMVPVENSILGEYFYHFKGARKDSEENKRIHMEQYK